jgi:hypothetical protein
MKVSRATIREMSKKRKPYFTLSRQVGAVYEHASRTNNDRNTHIWESTANSRAKAK